MCETKLNHEQRNMGKIPERTNRLPKSLEGFSLSAEQLLIFQHVITVDTVNQASPFCICILEGANGKK